MVWKHNGVVTLIRFLTLSKNHHSDNNFEYVDQTTLKNVGYILCFKFFENELVKKKGLWFNMSSGSFQEDFTLSSHLETKTNWFRT